MVALVRAGVTATCSGADHPRYGHLDVDSNLPDARIALGGPDPQRVQQGGAGRAPTRCTPPNWSGSWPRRARPGFGCRRETPLSAVWVPDADLRAPRALPVLIIDGSGARKLIAAVKAVIDDLGDAEIVVAQQAPSGSEPFADHTVALLNRGVPSFAVETPKARCIRR